MKKTQNLVTIRKAFEAAEGKTLQSRKSVAAPLEDWIEDPGIYADESMTLIEQAERAVEEAVKTLQRQKQSIDEETPTITSSLKQILRTGFKPSLAADRKEVSDSLENAVESEKLIIDTNLTEVLPQSKVCLIC